ncbi:MAG TPA: carboxypeptidase regulatory-like domain-containing protein, partial [Dehalococcoidia bacterium]|nr:carboxypeptidase regulatory-like domain-containing protein [Dehalococcoidia bacterium]
IDTRGQVPDIPQTVLMTGRIPFNIAEAPAGAVFTLSGTVTDAAGAPMAGVTMALTGAATKTVVTNAFGNYTLADLPNGSYTVTPSLGGSVFAPPNASVAVNGADVTGQNFAGAQATFGISGTVTGQAGAPLAGVTISLTGAATTTVVTDANGSYSLTGLANGNYTLTPSLAGFAFTPVTTDVTINAASVSGRNFAGAQVAGTFAVSGTVTNQTGAPLSGVTIALTGAAVRTVATDASGNYSLTGLANGSYTVTPSLAGFVFTPASANVTISGADVTAQNFVGAQAAGTFAISGAVTSQAGAPLAGVAIALTGAANRTVATDASGNYSLTALANGNYTVTPSLGGFAFTPPSANVTLSGANVTAQNFVGTAAVVAFAISGAVTNQAGTPLAGVTITLAGADNRTLVTDASGNYSLTGLPNGIYTVTPSFAGISFTPSSRSITIVGGNAPGQNFVGTVPGLGFRREIWLPFIGKGPQAGF